MIQLIKRHSPPRKHLALARTTLLKSNYLFSSIDHIEKQNLNLEFTTNNNRIKDLLLEHIKSLKNDKIRGIERGIKRDQTSLLYNLLDAFFYWHSNIELESNSMLDIASQISENILNKEHNITLINNYKRQLTEQLRSYFKISIHLPLSVFNEHSSLLSSYQELSGDMALLTISKHDKEPELRISIIQEIFVLCLSGIDIRLLLAKINTFFLTMNRSVNQSQIEL